jgi:rhamnosyltransferase subunit B
MKMHFVISSAGTSGDILPFIEMGKSLLKRKHDVSVIVNPYFEGVLQSAGLPIVPFGTAEQAQDLFNDPGLWNQRTGFHLLWKKTIQPNTHSIRTHIQSLSGDRRVVVLTHPAVMALVDLARADRSDIRIVVVYQYPTIIRTFSGKKTLNGLNLPTRPALIRKALYSLTDRFVDAGILPALNRERLKLGLAPMKHFFPHIQSSADLYVTLFPEWFAPAEPDYPKPLIQGNFVLPASAQGTLSEELIRFLDAGQPPFLFSPGTENLHARAFFEIAIDAVRSMNGRAIMVTKLREQLPSSLPDFVLWQKYVPFDAILPRVAVLVHHGGIGSVAIASKIGVRQLVVPFAYDQFDNARLVKDLGLGDSIPIRSLTPSRLCTSLREITDSAAVQESCRKVAARFASGPPIDTIMDQVVSAVEGNG